MWEIPINSPGQLKSREREREREREGKCNNPAAAAVVAILLRCRGIGRRIIQNRVDILRLFLQEHDMENYKLLPPTITIEEN